ncbi:MAG: hypothetical protein QF654_02495 [Alphaproteobacteria bacterium]|nr:hypothetical protein [Alphaproteobacteria bacterium]
MGQDIEKQGEIEITPQKLREFEELFDEWRLSGRNAFILEAGGPGALEDLARRLLGWAQPQLHE